MQELIRSIWNDEYILKDWNTEIIIPVFKKANAAKVENYRGIALLNVCYKVLSLAILRKLEVYITSPY